MVGGRSVRADRRLTAASATTTARATIPVSMVRRTVGARGPDGSDRSDGGGSHGIVAHHGERLRLRNRPKVLPSAEKSRPVSRLWPRRNRSKRRPGVLASRGSWDPATLTSIDC